MYWESENDIKSVAISHFLSLLMLPTTPFKLIVECDWWRVHCGGRLCIGGGLTLGGDCGVPVCVLLMRVSVSHRYGHLSRAERGADGAGGPPGGRHAVHLGDGLQLPAGPQGLLQTLLPESQGRPQTGHIGTGMAVEHSWSRGFFGGGGDSLPTILLTIS